MSVFNGEEYLKQSIKSILCQTFTDFEFIIIDDCSMDSTVKIINTLSALIARITTKLSYVIVNVIKLSMIIHSRFNHHGTRQTF